MKVFITCISIEFEKFLKSKIPLMSILALSLVPFSGGFFMFILKDPELAETLGFISTKAQLMGSADWPSYLELLTQAIAVGGLIVFGFIASWIFGREYSDRTVKDLLALPVHRSIIVLSKFTVVVVWCLILSVFVFIFGLMAGSVVGLPGWSINELLNGILTFVLCSVLTILLSTPVGFFASVGRGYLFPLGFVIFTIVFSQVVAALGYGDLFPWAVPAVASGISGEGMIEYAGLLSVVLTSLLGLSATVAWWKYADQY